MELKKCSYIVTFFTGMDLNSGTTAKVSLLSDSKQSNITIPSSYEAVTMFFTTGMQNYMYIWNYKPVLLVCLYV